MSERHWYQDGWVVFCIVAVVGFLGLSIYGQHRQAELDARPEVIPKLSGRLSQPLLGSPTLEITIWHQYPATLRSVVLCVNVNEDPAKGEQHWDRREHSFETWQPNVENAVKFSFPLKRYDPNHEIHIGCGVLGKTIKPYLGSAEWLGDGWKQSR